MGDDDLVELVMKSLLGRLVDTSHIVRQMLYYLFQLVNQKCMGDDDLVELVMKSLLGRLVDTSHVVRQMLYYLFQLVNQKCMGDDDLVELVMNSLLGRLVDTSHVVRQMCIRGLGNIASIGKAQVTEIKEHCISQTWISIFSYRYRFLLFPF